MKALALDSLGDFTVFVQVAETRSFAATGRLLGVSASAVGKRVARLEERLGVRLFHRSTRSITMTAEGAMFLARSRRVLAEIEEAELELSQSARAPRGRLRVSLPLVGSLFLPVMADFMQAHPDIDLHLDFTDRVINVIEEGFDAVLRTGEPADSGLSARRLGSFPMLMVASPGYLSLRGRPERPSDLADHACLHYCFANTGKLEAWPVRREVDAPEVRIPQSMVCNTIEARVCFAERGLGITCLPEFAARDGMAKGTLCAVLEDCTEPQLTTFRILWPSGRYPSPKLRAFIDFLSERVFTGPSATRAARA